MTARAFFPTKRPDGKIIGITSSGFVFPAPLLVGTGSYNASKLAQAKVLEFMAAENPDTFVGIVNPGFIVTEMVQKNGFADRAPADARESVCASRGVDTRLIFIRSGAPSQLCSLDGQSRSCLYPEEACVCQLRR